MPQQTLDSSWGGFTAAGPRTNEGGEEEERTLGRGSDERSYFRFSPAPKPPGAGLLLHVPAETIGRRTSAWRPRSRISTSSFHALERASPDPRRPRGARSLMTQTTHDPLEESAMNDRKSKPVRLGSASKLTRGAGGQPRPGDGCILRPRGPRGPRRPGSPGGPKWGILEIVFGNPFGTEV
jgi:hypothetical protein